MIAVIMPVSMAICMVSDTFSPHSDSCLFTLDSQFVMPSSTSFNYLTFFGPVTSVINRMDLAIVLGLNFLKTFCHTKNPSND